MRIPTASAAKCDQLWPCGKSVQFGLVFERADSAGRGRGNRERPAFHKIHSHACSSAAAALLTNPAAALDLAIAYALPGVAPAKKHHAGPSREPAAAVRRSLRWVQRKGWPTDVVTSRLRPMSSATILRYGRGGPLYPKILRGKYTAAKGKPMIISTALPNTKTYSSPWKPAKA